MEWRKIYNQSSPNFANLVNHPDEWQLDLAKKIRSVVRNGSLLEAGCGYGVTSLLVGEDAQRTLLDLEPKAIEIAKEIFKVVGHRATFVVGDLFRMGFQDNSFDVVFNAGVLEHFNFKERVAALSEMVRITKPGGKIIVAVPNHYSVPYRFSYSYRKKIGKWPYPDEEKIYDLSCEISDAGRAVMISREVIDYKTIFIFLSRTQKLLFKLLHMINGFEGYLTVLTHEKNHI